MRRFILSFFFITVIISVLTGCNQVQFDSKKWINWEESEANPSLRWNMSNNLVNDYNIKGMTVEQIIKLLGEPDKQSNVELRYYLGYSGHGIDTGALILILNNGTVTYYKIWHG